MQILKIKCSIILNKLISYARKDAREYAGKAFGILHNLKLWC
jgi:hypothetical protein